MKVLFATPYLPYPPDFGGARRMYELIRGVRRSSDVQIAESDRRQRPALGRRVARRCHPCAASRSRHAAQRRGNAERCRCVRWHRPILRTRLYDHHEFQRALDRLVATSGIDLVQFEFSQMGDYRVRSGLPTLLDVHNVEHDLMRRMASSGFERAQALQRHRIPQVSTRGDFGLAQRNLLRRDVQPRCGRGGEVHQSRGSSHPQRRRSWTIFSRHRRSVRAGNDRLYRRHALSTQRRRRALLCRKDLPVDSPSIPSATFNVVGADPMPEVSALAPIPGVTVSGTVPDVRPWLESAEVVVVPLLSGGGTRHQDSGSVLRWTTRWCRPRSAPRGSTSSIESIFCWLMTRPVLRPRFSS